MLQLDRRMRDPKGFLDNRTSKLTPVFCKFSTWISKKKPLGSVMVK